jgi:TonB family protein
VAPTPPPPPTVAVVTPPPVPTAAPAPTPAPAAEIYNIEDVTTRPTAISNPAPAYSREAIEAKVTGKVIARCVVTASGSVTGCRIVKGVPFMDQPVLSALQGWKYSPATKDGKPVSVNLQITLKMQASQ